MHNCNEITEKDVRKLNGHPFAPSICNLPPIVSVMCAWWPCACRMVRRHCFCDGRYGCAHIAHVAKWNAVGAPEGGIFKISLPIFSLLLLFIAIVADVQILKLFVHNVNRTIGQETSWCNSFWTEDAILGAAFALCVVCVSYKVWQSLGERRQMICVQCVLRIVIFSCAHTRGLNWIRRNVNIKKLLNKSKWEICAQQMATTTMTAATTTTKTTTVTDKQEW